MIITIRRSSVVLGAVAVVVFGVASLGCAGDEEPEEWGGIWLGVPLRIEQKLLSQDAAVRIEGVRAVAEIGGETAVICLVEVAKDESQLVRMAVCDALVGIGADAAGPLSHALFGVSEFDLTELGAEDSSSVAVTEEGALAAIYGKATISRAMVRIGRPSIEKFRRIGCGNVRRQNVLRCLDQTALDVCLSYLSEGDEKQRASAAGFLGVLGRKAAVEPLCKALLEDPSDRVRDNAAWSLGMLDDPAAKEALRRSLANRGEDAPEEVWALGMLRDREAVPLLLERLGDERYAMRSRTIEALGNIGDKTILPRLRASLHDSHKVVRFSARVAVAKMEGRPGDLFPLMFDTSILLSQRGEVALALSDIGGDEALQLLIKAYRNELAPRETIAEALGNLEAREAVEVLVKWLKQEGGNLYEVRACVHALARIGGPESREILLQSLNQTLPLDDAVPPVRKGLVKYFAHEAAVKGFQIMREPRAVAGLIRALEHEDPYIACQAAVALGKQGDPKAVGPLKKAMARPIPLLKRVSKEAIAEIIGHSAKTDPTG